MAYVLVFTSFLVAASWLILKSALYYASKRRLPPGPKPLPIIGNAHQMPTKNPWLTFSSWRETYGDVMYLNVLGQPIVVINSAKVAKDLLDKRSTIYSDRPVSVMCGELVGFNPAYGMQNYGEKWRKQRRMVSQSFSISKVSKYYGLQEREAATLMHNILKDTTSLFSEVQLRVGVVVMRIIYGYPVKSEADAVLKSATEMMEIFNKTANPGNYLVDLIPTLKYLPRWMPGSGFLAEADTYRQRVSDTAHNTYNWCKKNLESGKTKMPNLCGNFIQDAGAELSVEEAENLIWAAVGTMGGGLDTSASSILSFMMAMILYPDIQKKAQAELDAVVGPDRLPHISDRAQLPYIRSIEAEVLRWAPAGPLGVPHVLSEDDVYEDYHLAKGTIVLSNIWHMLHDPEIYERPMDFIPERFRGDDAEMAKVSDVAFGFGRRVCPGKNFADGTLFANIATALATCHILPGLDEHGEEVLPSYTFTTGTISFPEAYKARIRPRSAQAAALLSEASAVTG